MRFLFWFLLLAVAAVVAALAARLNAGSALLVALLEGRYGKAQQEAQEALALPHSSGLAALVAARAAIDVRQFDAAEAYLGRPETQARSLAVPRLTLSAEIALEQGQP